MVRWSRMKCFTFEVGQLGVQRHASLRREVILSELGGDWRQLFILLRFGANCRCRLLGSALRSARFPSHGWSIWILEDQIE